MNAEKTGRLISELRKEKGLTQQQMAEQLYVSDKAVSRWETGRGFPEITVLENIAQLLSVSVAEIIKGERIEETVSSQELASITNESILMSKEYIERKKIGHFFTGFLCGTILLIIAIAHLHSPIYFNDPERIMEIQTTDDRMVTAILDQSVSGYGIEETTDEEGEVCRFVSCYTTKWYELFGKKEKKIALLSENGDADFIYYYPYDNGDKLLWSKDGKEPSYGVETLPRLVYNYWIVLSAASAIFGMIAYLLLKKKYYARIILKIAMFPVSLMMSILLILSGHFNEIYNATYYFSGILMLSIALYAFLLMILKQGKKQKSSNGC